jgi:hypothetical protein
MYYNMCNWQCPRYDGIETIVGIDEGSMEEDRFMDSEDLNRMLAIIHAAIAPSHIFLHPQHCQPDRLGVSHLGFLTARYRHDH